MKLQKNFYSRNSKVVAKELLGKILVHHTGKGVLKGRIVETEAYFGKNDPASHASGKVTKRNIVMYKEPGTIYVYFTYGNHHMLNIVTEKVGVAGAVLIRALEPLEGIEIMKENRCKEKSVEICNGPGKLTKALGIDIKFNGRDMTSEKIYIENNNERPEIVSAARIGLSEEIGKEALEAPLRFYIRGNLFVSKK